MEFNITLLPGDGIGPEVVHEAIRVLDEIAKPQGPECVRPRVHARAGSQVRVIDDERQACNSETAGSPTRP